MAINFTLASKKAIGNANGTFGELLQGILPNNKHFLVTLPINKYSICEFSVDSQEEILSVIPVHKTKTLVFIQNLLTSYSLPIKGTLFLESELEEGKGLASSTADLIAAARAIESYYEITIPIHVLEAHIRKIEPSDGIMHKGIVAYYHKDVRLKKVMGNCPPLTILAIDEGGIVDTVKFNKASFHYTDPCKTEYQILLNKLTHAFQTNNIKLLGEVATRSAELNQYVLPKKHLDLLKGINEKIDSIGVITAHSGTLLGILLDKTDPSYQVKLQKGIYELQQKQLSFTLYHTCSE